MSIIEIKTFKSQLIASNMYILMHGKNSIIIDPCISEEVLIYLKTNSLSVDYIILTHEHYDHISGVNWLKEIFNCKVICSRECAEAIEQPSLNYSKYFDVLMELLQKDKEIIMPFTTGLYSCSADINFEEQKIIEWIGHKIDLISTPGHSKGSTCILFDNKYLFSGDSLLRDYPTTTRLKGGNTKIYKDKTLKFLKSLSPEIIVYPGHYESFVLKDRIKKVNV